MLNSLKKILYWNNLFLFVFLFSAGIIAFYGCSSSAGKEAVNPADISGNWELYYMDAETGRETGPGLMEISQTGSSLSFIHYPAGGRPFTSTGSINTSNITLTMEDTGQHLGMKITGKLYENGTMSGTWTDTYGNHGTWDAARNTMPQIVFINLGDSMTNGVQSGDHNVNEFTQVHGFTQIIADMMRQSAFVFWENPFLSPAGERKEWDIIPYNLGVSGAAASTLLNKKTGTGSTLMDTLLTPIPALKGSEVSQLEAAEYVAGLYPGKKKIFTLWIGGNDVLGTVTAGGGTEMTVEKIQAFLSDTGAGHDLDSVLNSLTEIVERLKKIPDSLVFMANIPDVASLGCLFYKNDIESLAAFPGADINVLEPGQAIGFGAFLNPDDPENSIARALNSNNEILNAVIAQTIAASDGFSLNQAEAEIINKRIEDINEHIRTLAENNQNIKLVDINALLKSIVRGEISIKSETLARTFGRGIFSLDGVHLSNTGYALAANEFIKAMNNSGTGVNIPQADIESVWNSDPYRDRDGDGWVPGPENLLTIGSPYSIINPALISLMDCDDTNPDIVSSYISGLPCR